MSDQRSEPAVLPASKSSWGFRRTLLVAVGAALMLAVYYLIAPPGAGPQYKFAFALGTVVPPAIVAALVVWAATRRKEPSLRALLMPTLLIIGLVIWVAFRAFVAQAKAEGLDYPHAASEPPASAAAPAR